MTEGRPVEGETFGENMQDYIRERATYGTDTNELDDAVRRLEQERAELEKLQAERSGSDARPYIDNLIAESQGRIGRMQFGDEEAEDPSGVQANPRLMTPEAEARRRATKRLDCQTGMGNT